MDAASVSPDDATSAQPAPTRGTPGRSLDSTKDPLIHDAAIELIAELGYERVSMEAIAARAQASKATLYRRWPSKAELVADAMKCRMATDEVLPDTGDVREDLLSGLRRMTKDMAAHDVALTVGLMNAMRSDPELARVIRERMFDVKHAAVQAWLRRAIERGQLPRTADVELFQEVAPAMVFMRLMVTGQPVDEVFIRRIVDDVLLPLLFRNPTDPRMPEENPIVNGHPHEL
ncbi:TetR/AcrR family transcriptional regulator [Jatrophihabitans telluris]|uniref:TetR/AcrR family transcriptional regulator n=1 Tax=Jatrophihabitans telluris TaxID=2038343 RepID=A0ABY4QZL0_9ACTN|nr:TetR/AcrR family transcriptional regulator [Jatrophihabitans telluris]UQX88667.1 TetR/AcrR family transcriptional regulator [Jatrophihabitans telluris]